MILQFFIEKFETFDISGKSVAQVADYVVEWIGGWIKKHIKN